MAAAVVAVLALAAGCSRESDGQAVRADSAAAGIPTVVVLDASDSMNTADAPGPRWAAAKAAAQELVSSLPPDTDFGLVVFGAQVSAKSAGRQAACADVQVVRPLGSADAAEVTEALDGLTPQGFTPIGTALQEGAALLPDTESALVLVSDGESTCAPDPCETAASIRAAKPKTTISAVGFRTDADSLQCVARDGGGVFVTADNAEQLTARLAAVQNAEVADSRLAPTGRGDAKIGDTLDQVAADNEGFPTSGRTEGDRLIIVWKDCTYTFDADRTLIEIAPGDPAGATGVTIDGVTAGTPGSRVVELYGEPTTSGDGVATFPADEGAGTGYRIGYRGGDEIGDGTVTTVVLCRCAGDDSEDKPEPVLGRDQYIPYAVGFGAARPAVISFGSTASSTIARITWDSWGGQTATGTGVSQLNGVGNPLSTMSLKASDLGWCDGAWTYRKVQTATSEARLDSSRKIDVCRA
ncbi:hypothetical protein GCM10022231_04030 [Gordonia caeni]|uniref:VWFA domain-containing protein n=2 Tax=Gordonia caeni TaxID=1007097 RepID=A0ABP7NNB0_9ACTN